MKSTIFSMKYTIFSMKYTIFGSILSHLTLRDRLDIDALTLTVVCKIHHF